MATKAWANVVYPTSDGKPMAETDVHYHVLVNTRERLSAWFAGRTDVYVSGNLLVYYVPGRPRVSLAPDGFVVFGVPPGDREVFKTWEEGAFPAVVFEFTSKTTRREDQRTKFAVYQDIWKVKEYFLFDPLGDYLDPPLRGYRMNRGELRSIKPTGGVLTSRSLGLNLEHEGARLVLRDPTTGAEVLTPAEAERDAALAEVARLKAELAAVRKRKP